MCLFKLNDYASFDQDLLRGTTRAVLRDDKGNFIAGENGKIDDYADVPTASLLPLHKG